MSQQKLKYCKGPCGRKTRIWGNIDGKGMCYVCYTAAKPPKALKRTPLERKPFKRSKKALARRFGDIKVGGEYYALAIEENRSHQPDGICRCENCDNEVVNPTGMNVSHIWAKGCSKAAYTDPLNHCFLCAACEKIWTSADGGSRKAMKIWAKCELILNYLHQTYRKRILYVKKSS